MHAPFLAFGLLGGLLFLAGRRRPSSGPTRTAPEREPETPPARVEDEAFPPPPNPF